jgi:hypothetical protein
MTNSKNSLLIGGAKMKKRLFFIVLAIITILWSCKSPEAPEGKSTEDQPTIALDKTTLSFSGVKGQSNPSNQSFQIRNSSSGELNYQIKTDKNWITTSPTSGNSSGEWDTIQVSIDIQGMNAGTHSGEIEISCSSAMNSPQTVAVALELFRAQKIKPGEWTAKTGFGRFDFIVDSRGDYITKVTLRFSNWRGRSGSIGVSRSPGWAISNRKFDIDIDLLTDPFDPLKREDWTFKGTFSENGKKASGTWKAVISGSTYSGTWEGSPKS